jgi:hypothetical protein
MKHEPVRVLVEHANTNCFRIARLLPFVIEKAAAGRYFLGRERYVVIIVEVGAKRRNPLEALSHALSVHFEFRPGRA